MMMAKSKKKDKDRLEALKAKLQNTDTTGGRRQQYFNAEEGENTIRILPAVGDMEFFFQEVGVHYMPGKERVYCPSIISDGELDCPICELVQDLYRAGDNSSEDLASDISVSRKFWMNVIDRGNESAGPMVYTAPVSVFSFCKTLVGDPDYGYFMDPYEGVDIVVVKEKTGPRNYDVDYETYARRHDTPLAYDEDGNPDEKRIEKWLDSAKELTWTVLSNDPEEDDEISAGYGLWVKPYERIVSEYLAEDEEFAVEADGTEAEEEAESPAQEEVTKRRARRARRRRAVK